MKTFYVFRDGLVAGYESIDIKGLSYGGDWLNDVYRAGKRVGRFAAVCSITSLKSMNCGTTTKAGEFLKKPVPMSNPQEAVRRLLGSISESLNLDTGKLARLEGQFITPSGHQVYPVRLNGRTAVTVPED